MTSLRDMTGQYTELLAIASDAELPENALADTLEGLKGEIKLKAENIAHVLLNSDTDVAALDAEIQRLTNRKKAIENGKERLRDYLRFNMEATRTTKIDCPLFSISLGKARDKVSIDNEDVLDESYFNVKITRSPDKRVLLDHLKKGIEIEGVSLIKSQSPLRIR